MKMGIKAMVLLVWSVSLEPGLSQIHSGMKG